jgi:Flp pilus assembly protein TadD
VRDGLAAKKHTEAAQALRRALDRHPGNRRIAGELGWASFLAGDLAAAEASTLAAMRGCRDRRLKASLLYNLGRIAEQRKDLAAARRFYGRSIALRPNATVAGRLKALGK